MKKSDEVFTIECTIRNIFNKDVIKKIDVAMANNLLKKWKVLTNHVENTESPIKDNILEEEPNYK
jgi:hypothetical protein